MREFKFKCPVCSQHIKSNVSQVGAIMECPTCFQRIVVPQAPESDDPKFIVSGTRYTEKDSPAAGTRARTGSITEAVAEAKKSPARGKLPWGQILAGVIVLAVLAAGAWLGVKFLNRGPADETRWTADNLPGAEGQAVSSWKASSGLLASQSHADNSPTLHLNGMNGHHTLRFSAASRQFLTVADQDSPLAGATDFTLVVVFSTATPGLMGQFFENTGLIGGEQYGTVADWALGINGNELSAGLGAGNGGCNQDVTIHGGAVTDGTPHVAMYVRQGATITLYVDGTQVATQSGLCLAPRGQYSFVLGAMTTGTGFFTGDIAEVQLYKHALSAQDITKVALSLGQAYGVGARPSAASTTTPSTAPIAPPLPVEISAGRIGIGTWDTQIMVSNVVVTSGGQVLYVSDFSSNTKPKEWTIGTGHWTFANGAMEQLAPGQNFMAVTGDETWSNYIYKAQVTKISGLEGFLILFNFKNINNYAQFNIGGWGNTLTGVEYVVNGVKTTGPRVPGTVKTGQWYNVELDVNQNNVHCYLDGQLIMTLGN